MTQGPNNPGPKRPTYRGWNDPHPEFAETTQAQTTRPELFEMKGIFIISLI